ncbi:MAG: hypothetical protein ACLUKN_09180 [Bacilli bacterium]
MHILRGSACFCVKLSERYITSRFLPDKAIDVIDRQALGRA